MCHWGKHVAITWGTLGSSGWPHQIGSTFIGIICLNDLSMACFNHCSDHTHLWMRLYPFIWPIWQELKYCHAASSVRACRFPITPALSASDLASLLPWVRESMAAVVAELAASAAAGCILVPIRAGAGGELGGGAVGGESTPSRRRRGRALGCSEGQDEDLTPDRRGASAPATAQGTWMRATTGAAHPSGGMHPPGGPPSGAAHHTEGGTHPARGPSALLQSSAPTLTRVALCRRLLDFRSDLPVNIFHTSVR